MTKNHKKGSSINYVVSSANRGWGQVNVSPKEGLVHKAILKGHLIKDDKGRKDGKIFDFETTSFMNGFQNVDVRDQKLRRGMHWLLAHTTLKVVFNPTSKIKCIYVF